MDTFRNTTELLVDEAIDGLCRASGGDLLRLPRRCQARVVLRSRWDKTKTSLISGGGAGHEPLHAGLVAPGLLTAAVVGGVFASPSADAVLTAIEATTGPRGCVLIVKNYTGDTLNFGLAAERARLKGFKVEMVTVGDDVARYPAPRPRGIAGTVFIHKVAGHFVEIGAPAEKVAQMAALAANHVYSLGVSRGTCLVPGNERVQRFKEGEIEIGLGIHGEVGRRIVKLESSENAMMRVEHVLKKYFEPFARYAILFNNLGGLSGLEMGVLFNDFAKTSMYGQVDYVMGPTTLVTALDMPGFSISIIKLDPEYSNALLAPILHRCWPGFARVNPRRAWVQHLPEAPPSAPLAPSEDPIARAALEAAADACVAARDKLNALDAETGDGDTGTTLASGAAALKGALDTLPLANPGPMLARVGDILARAMGGTAGALLGILCTAAAVAFDGGAQWPAALDAGVAALMRDADTSVGDKSCVDALRPAADALLKGASIKEAAAKAREGAEKTKAMNAYAGRALYVPEEASKGAVDPGAEAVALVFEAIAEAV